MKSRFRAVYFPSVARPMLVSSTQDPQQTDRAIRENAMENPLDRLDASRLSPFYQDHHLAWRDTLRRWVAREITPFVEAWDEAESFPRELYRKASDGWSPEQRALVMRLRTLVARFEDTRDLRLMGGYQAGADAELDQAVLAVPKLYTALNQLPHSIERIQS